MPKAIRGVYENGEIKLPLKELPEVSERLQIIVIFLESDANSQQREESIITTTDVALPVTPEKESPKENKAFSIADSNFFSLPPEHLGGTSADELTEYYLR